MKTTIILLAAGKGARISQPKRDVLLAGKTLLQWNLHTIQKLPFEKEVIIVGARSLHSSLSKVRLNSVGMTEVGHIVTLVNGGKTRHESVKMGLKKTHGDIVIIHNVANPMAQVSDFVRIHQTLLKKDAACFVGQKMVDTVREVNGTRSKTIPRENLWRVQTPQGFRLKTLLNLIHQRSDGIANIKAPFCHPERSRVENGRGAVEGSRIPEITDEIMLFESTNIPIIAHETSSWNQKVTYPEDVNLLERYLNSDFRVGIGEDSHSYDSKGTLVLGGVRIPGYPKLKANSDGDVILHALCNTLRSAMGKGSFSKIADPLCRQGVTDSRKYLEKILHDVQHVGWRINSVAISITGEKPHIDSLVLKLKKSLSQLLQIDEEKVGITASSGNRLTSSLKQEERIHCQASIILLRFL